MAKPFQEDKLGRHRLCSPKSINLDTFPVRVRRQDSTIEYVMLMNEIINFIEKEMPNAVDSYMAYPQTFKYNQEALKQTQGFPEEARMRFARPTPSGPVDREQISKEEWRKRVLGDSSEAKTFRSLESLFQSRPSLFLTGVKMERVLQVARQAAKYSLGQARKQSPQLFSVPLTTEERILSEALGSDPQELEREIKDLISLIRPLTAAISRKDLLTAVHSKSVKPGFHLLGDKEKSQYSKNLTREINNIFDKSKRDLSDHEVTNYLTRFLLNLAEKKDEFDQMLADRDSSTFFQVEVKSYPQNGILDKDGFLKSLKKANEQLEKGDKFFQNVLAPAAQLSLSWAKVNIVCFPEITNREKLKALGMDDNALTFILTAEELELGTWVEHLGLPACQAPEEEYKRLLAVCVGSQHVAFSCQIFDFEEEHKETHTKLVGKRKPDEVVGVGGEEGPQTGATSIEFSDLKGKPLGHIWSILFWTQEQLNLLGKLQSGENLVLCGDYGTGKTSLMVFAALEAAKDPNCRVYFVPATNIFRPKEDTTDYILDEAIRLKFEGTSVEVVTIGDIRIPQSVRETFQVDSWTDDRHQLIRELVKVESQESTQTKFFIDELPVYQKDLMAILNDRSTQVGETLKAIDFHCTQAWIALSTLSLLDNSEALDKPLLPDIKTETQNTLNYGFSQRGGLESLTRNSSFILATLNLRVRNSSSIGECVPEDLSKFGKTSENPQTRVISGASVSTVVGLPPTFIHMDGIEDANYSEGLKEALSVILKLKTSLEEHVVILCGEGISVDKVSQTATKVSHNPTTISLKPNNEEYQQQQLRTWLKGPGGLLVTSNLQFAGMEAPTCVFITRDIVKETGARSGLLRATSRLVVVSYSKDIDMLELRKRFVVHDSTTIREERKKKEAAEEEKRRREEERRKAEERRRELMVLIDGVEW